MKPITLKTQDDLQRLLSRQGPEHRAPKDDKAAQAILEALAQNRDLLVAVARLMAEEVEPPQVNVAGAVARPRCSWRFTLEYDSRGRPDVITATPVEN